MTAQAATAATTMPPRAGTRGAARPARCCQASAQCPTQTGKGMKIRTARPIHTARTATAAELIWSGASGNGPEACGSAMIEPAAKPIPSPAPAAHPCTLPVPASSSWLRHMAIASAAPAKAPKMTAGTTSLMPSVVVVSVTISRTAVAPMAATSPTASPSQTPHRYNGAGSARAAARA